MKRHRFFGVAALVAVLFPGAGLAQEASVGAADPAVRLSLDEALSRALEQSEEVKTARAQVDAASAQVKNARSAALPQVNAQLSYNRALRSIFQGGGFTLPDSLQFDPDPNAPLEDRVRYLEDNATLAGLHGLGSLFSNMPFGQEHTWIGGISVTQPIFAGGRIKSAMDAASAAEDAAKAALVEATHDVAVQVKEAYYGAVLADRSVEIVEASVELAQEHLDQVRLQHEAGRASELEVLRAEVELKNLHPQLVQARNARDLALLNLKRLVNLPMDRDVELTTELVTESAGAARLASLELPSLEEAEVRLRRRAAVRAAEDLVEVRRELVNAAKGAYLPTVALMGNLSRQAFPNSGVFPRSDDWRDDWSVGIAVQWSLFDGFKREAEIDAARAEVRQAELQLDQLREAVRLEYEQALGELKRAQEQVMAAATNVEQAERVYELTELRYREGLATQLDVSNARLALQQARLNQVQAFHDAYVAVARAERALGIPVDQTVRPAR